MSELAGEWLKLWPINLSKLLETPSEKKAGDTKKGLKQI
jgi:hypothetical protein